VSIQVLPHNLILEQIHLSKLERKYLSKELLHVFLVFMREHLDEVGNDRLLLETQLCKQPLPEDVSEDLREVGAQHAQVVHVLLREADAVRTVHQLQDAEHLVIRGVTDGHGEVGLGGLLVLVG
jgi:hypothetical protein